MAIKISLQVPGLVSLAMGNHLADYNAVRIPRIQGPGEKLIGIAFG